MTTDTQLTPTDPEIVSLIDKEMREYSIGAYADHGSARNQLEHFARAVLARWGQPAHSGEPVYAFRRKGLDDFCTCTEKRYAELSAKPNLFETRIFYTAPQPVEREPLTHAQAKALVLKYGNDPLHLVLQVERAHGIKGGQHGADT